MSGRWWRAYSRARHDPKLLKLSDKHFRWWFNLVCVASENEGVLPGYYDIAAEFRVSLKVAEDVIGDLIKAGLFDWDGETARPHNWNVLQYVSDSSSNRVKQFRERQRNVSETPSESETESETDTEKRKTRAKARKSCIPDDWKPDDALIDYAKAQGCKDPHDTFERFRLHHAGKGTLHKDWTLAAKYWTRNEKNFAPRGGSGPFRPTMQTATSFPTKEDWDWKVKWHREKGMWKPDWGPEPGQPGCFVPKELLQ